MVLRLAFGKAYETLRFFSNFQHSELYETTLTIVKQQLVSHMM